MSSLVAMAAEKAFDKALDGTLSGYQQRKRAEAREVFVKRIAKGHLHAALGDDTLGAILVYLRAAQEGAARVNLEAMADFLANSMAEPEFAPDEFKRHARHLSELSYEECMALALYISACKKSSGGHVWGFALALAAKKESYFSSSTEFMGIITSLVRTGWIRPEHGEGGTNYVPTKSLVRMTRLLDLDEAIDRAKAAAQV